MEKRRGDGDRYGQRRRILDLTLVVVVVVAASGMPNFNASWPSI
uniref:Uncharacterized protein n=1 Tax=Setaria italica TaxID=4555 RepID=K3ZGG4_SETIT